MKKSLLLNFLFVMFVVTVTFSQTSDIGKPFILSKKIHATTIFYQTPSVNNQEEYNKKLTEQHKSLEKAYQFGKEHEVSIDIFEQAERTILPSGDFVYQFGIVSKNAISINLIFNQFHLSNGVNLYLVSPSKQAYIGAYTSLNNNPSKMLGTELVFDDQVIIEVFVPKSQDGQSILNLSTIVHGFQNINDLAKALNQSGNCQIDVNCPLGDGWQNQRNSVAMMVNGGGFCTGSLIHNTSGNVIPYFLSARHCGTSPGSWVFRFKYESPEGQVDCGTSSPSVDGPTTMSINGATLCANYAASDFTLSLLNSTPDPNWGVYYNGWDRRDIPATELTGIHHPNGDVKKISKDYSTAISSTFSGIEQNSHWKVPSWDFGTTEAGSSGSPLFDQNHRTIGQLQGGNSYCGAASGDLNDDYGKLARSWTGGGTPESRLSDWLDPLNLAPLFIDGFDPLVPQYTLDGGVGNPQVNFLSVCGDSLLPSFTVFNNGVDTLFGATIQYGFDEIYETIVLTDTIVTFQTLTIELPDTTLTNGEHTFSVIFSYPSSTDENNQNDTTTYTFSINKLGEPLFLDMSITCYASENRWEIIDNSQIIVAHGGPFPDDIALPIVDSFCLIPNCYTFKIYDSYGDGFTSSGCLPGSYTLKNKYGETLSELISDSANFGSLYAAPFCAKIDENDSNNGVKIYPNPTNSILKIVASGSDYQEVKITSITGQILIERPFYNQAEINVNHFSSGVYFVQLIGDSTNLIRPIVVE